MCRHCRPTCRPTVHSRFLFTSRPALGMGAWWHSPRAARARSSGAPGLRREGTHGAFLAYYPSPALLRFPTPNARTHICPFPSSPRHVSDPRPTLRTQASAAVPAQMPPGQAGGLPDVASAGPTPLWDSGVSLLLTPPGTELPVISTSAQASGSPRLDPQP